MRTCARTQPRRTQRRWGSSTLKICHPRRPPLPRQACNRILLLAQMRPELSIQFSWHSLRLRNETTQTFTICKQRQAMPHVPRRQISRYVLEQCRRYAYMQCALDACCASDVLCKASRVRCARRHACCFKHSACSQVCMKGSKPEPGTRTFVFTNAKFA